ncbi:MAG: apolipoprotein N-acyltransferase [Deltaproteobacteria bacterium RIFCSPLOWO2_12_FULL_60_19]|nr:MAG: apolipoprotein N-acyltransferase [Deltaproteobacteria bacterium RIFCSPLOWO2_12_FULL_60_19]
MALSAQNDLMLSASTKHLLLAASIGGVAVALPFLQPSLFPLAWVALVPLFWLVRRAATLRETFLISWLGGAVTLATGFYWVDHTMRVFGGIPPGLSELGLLLFGVSQSIPIALFALLTRLSGLGPLYLFPALLWVAIEFVFPQIFPWHLANSQSAFLALIQTADLAGPYGTSFLLVWLNALVYAALFERSGKAKDLVTGVAVLGVFTIAALFYGESRLNSVALAMRAAKRLEIAAIQGSIDIKYKWKTAFLESNLKSYLELTEKSRNAALYIWPESAVEAWVPEDAQNLPAEMVPALPTDSALIFGARSFRGDPRSPDAKVFNSAFLIDSRGNVKGHYHKQVLLAFGEYLPFAAVFSKVPGVPPIGDGFTRGNGPVTLDIANGIRVAPLICYEDLMPELARRFVREKSADILVNLTNDAWFGDTVAPWQHARLAQWRAIETRRSLVRVTNTGLTAIIDPRGEMVKNLPTFTPGVLTASVPIMTGETFYVRYGDWFAWMMVVASLAIVLSRWRRGK